MSFYTLRYLPGTDLQLRKHRPTQVHADTWVEAEDARLALPEQIGNVLEVVERGTER